MASMRSGVVWQQIQRLFRVGPVAGLTDRELLGRYADRGDEAAFEAIVALHGAMVLGVCRRLLHDAGDVEDAFQATFLVLVRKAGSLPGQVAVGPWLYGVAHRVALRARSEAARRRSRERTAPAIEAEAPSGGDGMAHAQEIGPLIDGELARLPAGYRAAVVLCYLEGRTHEEAARQLGWPLGTLKGRLARAKELLRGRLARRGAALSSASLVALFARDAGASVPSGWVEVTIKAARLAASGEATAGVVSASAVALAEGVLRAMNLNVPKLAAASVAAILTVYAGSGAFSQQVARPAEAVPNHAFDQIQKESIKTTVKAAPSQTVDTRTDPGPEVTRPDAAEIAKKRLTFRNSGPFPERQTRAIRAQLEERLTMPFPQETPLEDVLKYIKSNTQSEELDLPSGIPIHVDHVGLQEAEKTLQSPVTLDLDGIPLRRTLFLVLRQLGLKYHVADGLMVITDDDNNDEELLGLIPSPRGPSPFLIQRSKAERGEMTAPERKEFLLMLKDLKEIHTALRDIEEAQLRRDGPPLGLVTTPPPSGTPTSPK